MASRAVSPRTGTLVDGRTEAIGRVGAGSKTRAKGERTRERIVAAARRVLAEDGLGQFTTRNVAALSGVSHGMCHYHFADRSDLIVAVIEDIRADWITPFERAVDEPGTFAERSDRVIGLLATPEATDLLRLHSGLHWFALNDERVREALRGEYARWADSFVRLFQVLADERGDGLDPRAMGEVVAATADGLAAVQSLGLPVDADLIMRTLIRSLTNESPQAAKAQPTGRTSQRR